MSTEENKTIVRRWFEAGNTDLDAARELLAPNFVSRIGGSPPIQGFEGWKQFATMFRSAFPDFRVTIDDLIAEGDKVVALGSYAWRVKANGREFGGDFAHVWTIRDGKAIAFQEYMDTAVGVSAHQKAMSA